VNEDIKRMERAYSIEQIKDLTRLRGVETTGTKRNIIIRLVKLGNGEIIPEGELRNRLLSTQKIRMTPNVLQFWYLAEQASWEDASSPQEGHVYNILARHNNILEIRSLDEAMLLIKSAYWQGDTSGETQENVRTKQAIGRIGDRLIEMYGVDYRYPLFRSTKTGEIITLEEARAWVKATREAIGR